MKILGIGVDIVKNRRISILIKNQNFISRTFTKNLFKGTTISFFKKRKFFYVVSLLIVIGGIASLFTRGLDGGVEFTGGRTYRVEFSQKVDKTAIREAITSKSINEDFFCRHKNIKKE